MNQSVNVKSELESCSIVSEQVQATSLQEYSALTIW